MADDIVTRLRTAHLGRDIRTHYDGCIDAHPVCALAWALDEIDRLRAAGDALAKQITRPCRCVEAHDGAINETCAACAAFFDWQEARRG